MTTTSKILTGLCILGIVTSANSQGYISTLGSSTEGALWSIGASGFTLAQQFTTGDGDSYGIGSVSVDITGTSGSDNFIVAIFSDNSGQPGTQLANGLLSGPAQPTVETVNAYMATGLTLAADTTYWVVFDNPTDGSVGVGNTQGGTLNTTADPGWSLGSTGFRNEEGGPYNFTGTATPLFAINPAPEPSTAALMLLGGLGAFFLSSRKPRQ
jgi:PEP-CTERM motif